jgi:acetyl esterase
VTQESPRGLVALRQALTGKAIETVLSGLSSGGRFFHPKAQPWRDGVEVARNIPYLQDGGEHGQWLLDIYRPIGATGKLPVMLYVHGGGFRILSKDSHWMFGCGYAQAGFLVVNINYTLSRFAPFPAAVEDTFEAFRWLVKNIEAWGGDLDRLVFAGESAGANLVTSLAIACCWKRPEPHARLVHKLGVVPQALMPACGFLQASNPDRYLVNESLPTFVRDRIAQICRTYLPDSPAYTDATALADPVAFLEEADTPDRPLPPTFVACGTRDPVLEDSVRLGKALERFDSPSQLKLYEGGIHAFHAFVWDPAAVQCWADGDAFIQQHAGVPAPAARPVR